MRFRPCFWNPNLLYPRNHLIYRVLLGYSFLPCFPSHACDGCLCLCLWALSCNRSPKAYLNKFLKMSRKLSSPQPFSLRKRQEMRLWCVVRPSFDRLGCKAQGGYMLSLWLARLWESWNLQPQSSSLPGHGSLQKICEQSSGERSFSRCLDETVGFVTAQVKGRVLSPLGEEDRLRQPSSCEQSWFDCSDFPLARSTCVLSHTEHPIVWASLTRASAQLMCPFAVEWQLAAWPIDVAAVSGRDSCSTTRYGELREGG